MVELDGDTMGIEYNVRPPFDSQVGANNSNFTMVYGTYNELVTGASVNQRSHHNGGPQIVGILMRFFLWEYLEDHPSPGY